jgi:hypothetical protein
MNSCVPDARADLGRTKEKAEACANKKTSTDPVNFIASFFLFVVVGSFLGR